MADKSRLNVIISASIGQRGIRRQNSRMNPANNVRPVSHGYLPIARASKRFLRRLRALGAASKLLLIAG